ncbi:unnamed protein product [Caenorhabditis nigoni]
MCRTSKNEILSASSSCQPKIGTYDAQLIGIIQVERLGGYCSCVGGGFTGITVALEGYRMSPTVAVIRGNSKQPKDENRGIGDGACESRPRPLFGKRDFGEQKEVGGAGRVFEALPLQIIGSPAIIEKRAEPSQKRAEHEDTVVLVSRMETHDAWVEPSKKWAEPTDTSVKPVDTVAKWEEPKRSKHQLFESQSQIEINMDDESKGAELIQKGAEPTDTVVLVSQIETYDAQVDTVVLETDTVDYCSSSETSEWDDLEDTVVVNEEDLEGFL